jgi:hypothetical protein
MASRIRSPERPERRLDAARLSPTVRLATNGPKKLDPVPENWTPRSRSRLIISCRESVRTSGRLSAVRVVNGHAVHGESRFQCCLLRGAGREWRSSGSAGWRCPPAPGEAGIITRALGIGGHGTGPGRVRCVRRASWATAWFPAARGSARSLQPNARLQVSAVDTRPVLLALQGPAPGHPGATHPGPRGRSRGSVRQPIQV